MQVRVSLTIEIAASADLAGIEQQVQEVEQQAMRAVKKDLLPRRKKDLSSQMMHAASWFFCPPNITHVEHTCSTHCT